MHMWVIWMRPVCVYSCWQQNISYPLIGQQYASLHFVPLWITVQGAFKGKFRAKGQQKMIWVPQKHTEEFAEEKQDQHSFQASYQTHCPS